MLSYPVEMRGNFGIDIGETSQSTAHCPRSDSIENGFSIIVTDQWTTRITLTNIATTVSQTITSIIWATCAEFSTICDDRVETGLVFRFLSTEKRVKYWSETCHKVAET